MSGLTWLHLSDWHQKGREFDRDKVRDALLQDIEQRAAIHSDLRTIDFVVFSGDVAYHGVQEEYEAAVEQLFSPVLERAGVGWDRLFVVPGNHDVDRSAFRFLPAELTAPLTTAEQVNEWQTDPEGLECLLRPFQNYRGFLSQYVGTDQGAYAYLRQFEARGKRVALLGLNSALLSGRNREKRGGVELINDDRHLVLGEPQIHTLLGDSGFRGADVRIAVMHHPFDWLVEFDRVAVRDRLKKACHFILRGHEHEPEVTVERGTAGDCITIPAGASYDRREPAASRYANAYNYVHLDFKAGRGTVHLRRYEDRQGWIKDTGTTGDAKPGIYSFDLPEEWRQAPSKRPAVAPTPKPPHPELRERYLHWLAESCGKLAMKGISTPERPYIELSLDDIYVPLEAVQILPQAGRRLARRGKQPAEVLEAEGPATRPINLRDLLKVGPRIVVTGGPGSGKSTVLRYVAWTLAESLLSKRPQLARDRLGWEGPLAIPVFIPLHAFAEHRSRHCRDADPELTTLAACVLDYVTRTTGVSGLSLDFFKSLLEERGNCLVMLDGLDEVGSEADRVSLCQTVEQLASFACANRYIVTSRPAAYAGRAVIAADFRHVQVKPLERTEDHDDVEPLVRKLYTAAGHPERIEPLLSWLDQLEARYAVRGSAQRLIDSPLMVRMVAIVDLSGQKLPEQRAELYNRFADALLRATYHPDAAVAQALEKLGGPAEEQREWLARLAYAMHSREIGTRSLEESHVRELLRQHLAPTRGDEGAAQAVRQFIAATRSRGGLIDVRAGPPDLWTFTHQPFQEFLTAVYLADMVDGVNATAAELECDGRIADVWWQEVTLLLLGYLKPERANWLTRRLARLPDGAASLPALPGRAQMAAAERVGVALIERPAKLPQLEAEVAERLARMLQDREIGDAPAVLRAAAGRALAQLGDTRRGVGCVDGVPEMVWCAVPDGPFTMGSKKGDKDAWEGEVPQHEERSIIQPYWASRYAVTNAQFDAFVADGGYQDAQWLEQCWTKAGRRWLEQGKIRGPERYRSPFDLPNHPVVGVSWYEALAFCRWLTAKLQERSSPQWLWCQGDIEEWLPRPQRLTVHLPTEAEWEKASRGTDKWRYPWGDDFDPAKCNVGESGIGSTSAVGIFPAGDSPYGCADMSGNVWEWCSSKWVGDYKRYDQGVAEREDPEGERPRVVRGGSWFLDRGLARCACRYWFVPGYRADLVGFRVVVRVAP
jgi:formylglycine-generating enzyme required for sulfatase activity